MNSSRVSKHLGPYAVGFIFLIAVSGAVPAANRVERDDACTDTTDAAFKACQHEASDALGEAPFDPRIHPARFVDPETGERLELIGFER